MGTHETALMVKASFYKIDGLTEHALRVRPIDLSNLTNTITESGLNDEFIDSNFLAENGVGDSLTLVDGMPLAGQWGTSKYAFSLVLRVNTTNQAGSKEYLYTITGWTQDTSGITDGGLVADDVMLIVDTVIKRRVGGNHTTLEDIYNIVGYSHDELSTQSKIILSSGSLSEGAVAESEFKTLGRSTGISDPSINYSSGCTARGINLGNVLNPLVDAINSSISGVDTGVSIKKESIDSFLIRLASRTAMDGVGDGRFFGKTISWGVMKQFCNLTRDTNIIVATTNTAPPIHMAGDYQSMESQSHNDTSVESEYGHTVIRNIHPIIIKHGLEILTVYRNNLQTAAHPFGNTMITEVYNIDGSVPSLQTLKVIEDEVNQVLTNIERSPRYGSVEATISGGFGISCGCKASVNGSPATPIIIGMQMSSMFKDYILLPGMLRDLTSQLSEVVTAIDESKHVNNATTVSGTNLLVDKSIRQSPEHNYPTPTSNNVGFGKSL